MPRYVPTVSCIAFTTANYVARQTGWSIQDWDDGDRATNEFFAPLETYGERFDELLASVGALGFETIDLWGAHLSPAWATDEHVALAREALGAHDISVATYATWVDPANVERACELARAVGTSLIRAGLSGDPAVLAPSCARTHHAWGRNHPERTPAEVLARLIPATDARRDRRHRLVGDAGVRARAGDPGARRPRRARAPERRQPRRRAARNVCLG